MSHYYSEYPSSSGKTILIQTYQLGHQLKFKSQSGIFSWKKVDLGSELLLNNIELPSNKEIKLLDLGCGYGFLGISIAKAFPKIKVHLTDINSLAVKFTRENCKLNEVQKNTKVKQGHIYEPFENKKFNVIITNPPILAGKKILKEMIANSINYLEEHGSLFVVVPKKKGLVSMQKMFTETFAGYSVIAKGSGYWVLRGMFEK